MRQEQCIGPPNASQEICGGARYRKRRRRQVSRACPPAPPVPKHLMNGKPIRRTFTHARLRTPLINRAAETSGGSSRAPRTGRHQRRRKPGGILPAPDLPRGAADIGLAGDEKEYDPPGPRNAAARGGADGTIGVNPKSQAPNPKELQRPKEESVKKQPLVWCFLL